MWITLILICSSVLMVFAVGLCLCGRRRSQKNEWLGLDGMVTQKNPDENVNHLPSANAQCVPDDICSTAAVAAAGDAIDRRAPVVNNPRRSLPDIPSEGPRDGDGVTYEPSGDNFSELYATVEPYQNGAKAHMLVNNVPSRPSISQHSSISQADEALSPYARVKEHPYDKLRKTEHPYASVKSASLEQEDENSSSEATPRTSLLKSENPSTSQNLEPVAPPRSRRSSSQNGTATDNIPAASAVAGGIPANQELPYMTPPIAQTNFSGDSQDSSKGYTSITVREPLANIRAQTKEQSKVSTEGDAHYSTVSDDSDEMYTTIQDPNNPYTSGSETYAQIQPVQVMVAVEVNPVPQRNVSPSSSLDPNYESAPQPPSVDSLKHVTHGHSRQASNSSSIGILSSPKPEKRQANSPLPAPPPGSPLPINKSLDDMYAKVHKNKKKFDNDNGTSAPQNEDSPSKSSQQESRRSSLSINSVGVSRTSFENPHRSSIRSLQSENCVPEEHDYETLKKSHQKCSDPGYEQLRPRENDILESGYDTINSPPSLVESDPGYEVVKHGAFPKSEQGYNELSHKAASANDIYSTSAPVRNLLTPSTSALIDGYSVVNKKKNLSNLSSYESDTTRDISMEEPNYESMPSESFSEHNYALLKSGSDTDPNYESVNHNDPNYESVKYLDVSLNEPPYERLHDDDSSRTDKDVPEYEKVGNGLNSKGSDNEQGDMPDYETVPEKHVTVNGGAISEIPGSDDEAIVQV